jgi:signal recognition particle subunit SRP54
MGEYIKDFDKWNAVKKTANNRILPEEFFFLERRAHQILNGSRRARIARGSGTQVSDINRFIKQFEQTQKMMQLFTKKGGRGGFGRGPF